MSVNTKWAFLNPSHIQFKQLKDLLDTRIEENNGETIFEIGVCEREESGLGRNEYAQSVELLKLLANILNADCIELEQCHLESGMTGRFKIRKKVAQDIVRTVDESNMYVNTMIAM